MSDLTFGASNIAGMCTKNCINRYKKCHKCWKFSELKSQEEISLLWLSCVLIFFIFVLPIYLYMFTTIGEGGICGFIQMIGRIGK